MNQGMIWLCLLALLATRAPGQVAVVAHKEVPLDTLTKAQLLDFYSCETKFWTKDLPVVVIDTKPPSEAKTMFYDFLGMTASRMKSLWLKKMLMGEGEPPVTMKSEEDVLKMVETTPGALAFVSRDKINKQVKTLMIIGKMP